MHIRIITELEIPMFKEIIAANPDYLLVDFDLVQRMSTPILDPKNKIKKKKNLELEILKDKPMPLLDLNLKAANTKIIITKTLQARDLNYRKLRTITKKICSYNPFGLLFKAQPTSDFQNNNLIRLLVSKTEKENLILEIEGKYREFWLINKDSLGSLQLP